MDAANASAATLSEIEDHMSVVAAGYPMAQHGEVFQDLCAMFQARAIFFLLGEFDLDHYRWNLCRSVDARRFYLRKLRDQGGDDLVFAALSRTESVFCAIAVDDLESATELGALSPESWMPAGEYKEDYYYHATLHAVIAQERESASRYHAQMVAALDGLEDPRIAMCESFLENREDEFWPAFTEFVQDRHDRAVVAHDDGRVIDQPWLAAFQYVSIEAISWLKLAAATGFQAPESEFLMCPSPTLSIFAGPRCPDIFLELESQFGL